LLIEYEYFSEEFKCMCCLLLDVVNYLAVADKLAAFANLVGHALPLSNISVNNTRCNWVLLAVTLMLFRGCFYDLWHIADIDWCVIHYCSDEFFLLCSLAGSHLHVYMYVCVLLSWLNNVTKLWAALYEDVTSLDNSLSRFECWVDTGLAVCQE